MKWTLSASLLTVLVVEMHTPPPVDACGVKLTIKTFRPRKAVARTSNPSEVLLLGHPPRRLEHDLSAAGHRVDVAPNASAAKKKTYAVVIADSDLQDEARSNFRGAIVIVRTDDVVADVRSVENQVGRKPVRAEEARTVVAAGPTRAPTTAGPVPVSSRQIVAAAEPKTPSETGPGVTKPTIAESTKPVTESAPKPAPESAPRATKPTAVEPTRIATAVTPKEETAPKTIVPATNLIGDEVYFTLGNASAQTAFLTKAERWLKSNADAHVVVEGYADPSGNPDDNMALAQKRAEWVRDSLVAVGIDQSRLEVISYGDTRLKYGRTDHRNRRVAITPK